MRPSINTNENESQEGGRESRNAISFRIVIHVLYGAHCIPMKIKVLVLRMLGCSLLIIIEWLELRAAAESRSGATLLL